MIHPVVSIYSKDLNQTSLIVDDARSFNSVLGTLKLFIKPVYSGKKFVISSRFFPLSRYRFIQRINKLILHSVISRFISKSAPYILWINNPEFYKLHNGVRFTYLVLSCDEKILANRNFKTLYREYFSKAWVFAYRLGRTPKSIVFKNKPESAVIFSLAHL